ncbi:hypothetical protein B7P43_G16092 [Cryptotermes secundus]|uniref:Reverse transcriptase domain-containing protein n=1 Tax=Cryptotermes secundus TaxID=105785 RepID=A0A2J7PL70_9NEOP|nr:hypothetical protein B7P43_G16092 [Cryptotermes secundus]
MIIYWNQGSFEAEEPVPTLKEVEQAIKKLKNNKASGMDLITAELVKFAGPEYAKHLHQLIVKIWITEIIPEEWNQSIICPVHKKGRSTNDQIFTICQVLEKCNEIQIKTYHLFIDFAYDSIDRDSLSLAMEEMHIPQKLIALVRATMRKTQCQIKIQNMLSSPIITRNGV